jgi:hypothetical protein
MSSASLGPPRSSSPPPPPRRRRPRRRRRLRPPFLLLSLLPFPPRLSRRRPFSEAELPSSPPEAEESDAEEESEGGASEDLASTFGASFFSASADSGTYPPNWTSKHARVPMTRRSSSGDNSTSKDRSWSDPIGGPEGRAAAEGDCHVGWTRSIFNEVLRGSSHLHEASCSRIRTRASPISDPTRHGTVRPPAGRVRDGLARRCPLKSPVSRHRDTPTPPVSHHVREPISLYGSMLEVSDTCGMAHAPHVGGFSEGGHGA